MPKREKESIPVETARYVESQIVDRDEKPMIRVTFERLDGQVVVEMDPAEAGIVRNSLNWLLDKLKAS